MTVTELKFHDAARHGMLRGLDALAEAVKVTLGPRGRTVVLERAGLTPQVVNSGVLVARAITLADRFENMGAQLLREVAARTSEKAGDGTTTATVLAQAMVHEGMRCLAAGMNPMDLKRGIDQAVEAVVAELRRSARPCDSRLEIAHVAAISANNDSAIGELLAQAIDRVGRQGAITVEDGSGLVSALEMVEGLQLDRGFLSPYFINQPGRGLAVLEDVAILLCDLPVPSLQALLPLLDQVVEAGRPLLVVAEDLTGDALAGLVLNSLRGTLRVCAIRSPGFGEQRQRLLQDLAVLTGGTLVSEALGLPLAKAGLADLGRARRVEVGRDSTTVIGGGGSAAAIAARIAELRGLRDAAVNPQERAQLDLRAARLAGGVALLQVGAATETELKERRIRIEDALHATRAAVDEGIVPGGGVALLRARRVLDGLGCATLDLRSGVQVVARALEAPLRQIVANGGDEPSVVLARVDAASDPAFGYDAASRTYGDLLQRGVIDPVKVTRLALQNAASIAGLVLTTDCLIAAAPAGGATWADGADGSDIGADALREVAP